MGARWLKVRTKDAETSFDFVENIQVSVTNICNPLQVKLLTLQVGRCLLVYKLIRTIMVALTNCVSVSFLTLLSSFFLWFVAESVPTFQVPSLFL